MLYFYLGDYFDKKVNSDYKKNVALLSILALNCYQN